LIFTQLANGGCVKTITENALTYKLKQDTEKEGNKVMILSLYFLLRLRTKIRFYHPKS